MSFLSYILTPSHWSNLDISRTFPEPGIRPPKTFYKEASVYRELVLKSSARTLEMPSEPTYDKKQMTL